MTKSTVEPEDQNRDRKKPAAWNPGLFLALVMGAVLFWPLGVVGLIAVATTSEQRRLQALCVLWAGIVGFLWGWKLLWPFFD